MDSKKHTRKHPKRDPFCLFYLLFSSFLVFFSKMNDEPDSVGTNPTEETKKDGEPTIQTLDDWILAAGHDGEAQTTTTSTIVGDLPLSDLLKQQIRDIKLLSTYANAYGMKLLNKERKGEPFDFTDPDHVAEFTRLSAKYIHQAITEKMGEYLTLTDSAEVCVKKYNQQQFCSKDLFGSFSLPPSSMTQLESLLMDTFKRFSNVRTTFHHLIYVNYFEEKPGQENVHVAKMRLFYLHINNQAWSKKGEDSSDDGLSFELSFTNFRFTMNDENVEKNRGKLNQFLERFKDVSNFSPSVIRNDYTPPPPPSSKTPPPTPRPPSPDTPKRGFFGRIIDSITGRGDQEKEEGGREEEGGGEEEGEGRKRRREGGGVPRPSALSC